MATEQMSFDDALAQFETEEKKVETNFLEEKDEFKEALEKKDEVEQVDEIEKIEKEILEEVDTPAPVTTNISSAISKLVEEGSFFLFEDKQDISEYTEEELVDLLKANDEHKISTAVETQVDEFVKALPQELQFAVKYLSDGGQDVKGLLKALSSSNDVVSLELGKDDEDIIREYYSALEWNEDDINDKITALSDAGKEFLNKEAKQVKPKLDKMQEEVINSQLARQEKIKELQQQEMQTYFTNAEEAIKKGSLGAVKLDKKTQTSLYSGIVQPNYTTRRGTPTNELGYLLEKYQYVEPNFEKIYKALWLLKDEESFFEKYGTVEKNKEVEKIVRTLKTEQSKKEPSSVIEQQEKQKTVNTIKRQDRPFLAGLK